METHSRIPVWEISWTEEPDGLQCMGLQSQTRLSTETAAVAVVNKNYHRLPEKEEIIWVGASKAFLVMEFKLT